jgi:acyl-CoA hydrolase
MKSILLLLALTTTALASNDCTETTDVSSEPVTYEVNKRLPEHLEGATIIVRLKDGRESSVPAERYMVVPRKQQLVVGENKVLSRSIRCDDKDRNLLVGEVRKDHRGLDTEVNGSEAKTVSKRDLVPGVNYLRREVIGPIGIGAGIDANGTLKGLIGVEF